MDINHDIDGIIKDYTNSLPPVHHTEEEDTIMLNSILSRVEDISSKKRKEVSRFNSMIYYMKNFLRTNTSRYALAIVIVCIAIGIISYSEYVSEMNPSESYRVVKEQENNNNISAPKINSHRNTDTMLLASIDFDSGNRGGENTVNKETMFEIITTLLKTKNIKSYTNNVLITETIRDDTTSLILMFRYNLSSHNVTVLSVPNQSPIHGNAKANIANLLKEIEYDLQTKIRMLNE